MNLLYAKILYDVKILYENGACEIIKNCKDIITSNNNIILYAEVSQRNEYERHYIVMDNDIISVVITISESEE